MNDLKIFNRWKVQLTIAIHFISCKDIDEGNVMYSNSDNKKS